MIENSRDKGAKIAFLPEAFDYIANSSRESIEQAKNYEHLLNDIKSIARDNQIWLSLGGMHTFDTDSDKVKNSHILLNDSGEIVDWYDKIHLFEVNIPGKVQLKESNWTKAGDSPSKISSSPIGKLALGICYDVRFPKLSNFYRFSEGAEILTFPSAFTVPTGEAGHWHTLLKARAIENQCYVIAAAQVGQHTDKRSSYWTER